MALQGSLVDTLLDQGDLVPAPPHWPRWNVLWESPLAHGADAPPATEMTWSPDHAVLPSGSGGHIAFDRQSTRTTIVASDKPSAAALLHPYLASTGMIAGHWMGRFPYHAGSFQFDGRAWGVLGGREMGKSSLLMWLHRSGLPILSDDLLVLDGRTAYAGPRCLDLRKSAAEHFEAGEYLGVVGARERWRVHLPATEPEVPFAGWVLIGWGEQISIEIPPPVTRLAALARNRALTLPGVAAPGLLDSLEFPMVAFARPRDWHVADKAMSALLRSLEELPALGGGESGDHVPTSG